MSFIRPDFHPLWATSGSAIDPGPSKRATGWVALEKPAFTTFNFLDQQQSEFIEYLETTVLDSESLWKMSAFKANDRMTVAVTSGLTGTLSPKDGVFSATDVGAIYNAEGQKTTWSGQDLINTGDNTHIYPASRDTFIAYNDTLRTFEYNDVPNDDPEPTPTAGFLNFQRVVTDGSDIISTNDILPTEPIFDVKPTFGDTATLGSPGVNQSITIAGHEDSVRELVFLNNNSTPSKQGAISVIPEIAFQNPTLRLQTFVGSALRDVVSYRHSVGAGFPVASDTTDFLIVTTMDTVGHHTQIRGRHTTPGGGASTIIIMEFPVPTGQVASARVFYQEVAASVGRVATESHFVFDGGAPPTITQTSSGGSVQSGGLGANDLGFAASGGNIRLRLTDPGTNVHRFGFVVDLFQSVAP